MITTLVGTIKTLDNVLGLIKNGEDLKIKDLAENDNKRGVLYSSGSMVKLLNKFIIEPKIVVSRSLRNSEETEKAIAMNLDIFTSMYTQVFNVLVNVHGLDSNTAFDLLSSNYDTNGLSKALESMDTFISMEDSEFPTLPLTSVSMERLNNAKELTTASNVKNDSSTSKLLIREIEIAITVKADGKAINVIIPVMVKATILYTDFKNIDNMMSISSKDKGFFNRLDDYRAGVITLKDLIIASDLISSYKKKRIKDTDDLIKDMENRSRSSKMKAISDGALGYNKYYQMVIVSGEERAKIERNLSGKLSKDKYKEEFLEQTNSLSLTVMDGDWERATIFIKDMKGSSDVSYKSLSKQKSGDNMEDLLKLMMAGKTI